MPIQKTIEIPASYRLTLDIPRELPMGRTILTFTPAPAEEYVCPECGKTAHTPNAVTIAALEEGDAMMRGEIPANRFHSIEELLADLDS
ncbi:hypothetical protein AGMMS50268_40380 [Spirochaetia bacterium]|nr:hypothetical protein AGMMS50268_40380 [Spirochaetia bacterium]